MLRVLLVARRPMNQLSLPTQVPHLLKHHSQSGIVSCLLSLKARSSWYSRLKWRLTLGGESIGLCRVVNTRHKRLQIDLMQIKSQLRVILESATSNVIKACTRNNRRLTLLTVFFLSKLSRYRSGECKEALLESSWIGSEGKAQIPETHANNAAEESLVRWCTRGDLV